MKLILIIMFSILLFNKCYLALLTLLTSVIAFYYFKNNREE